MSRNNAYERKKFNARIKREFAEYQAAGMTEEQIAEILLFDEKIPKRQEIPDAHTGIL